MIVYGVSLADGDMGTGPYRYGTRVISTSLLLDECDCRLWRVRMCVG